MILSKFGIRTKNILFVLFIRWEYDILFRVWIYYTNIKIVCMIVFHWQYTVEKVYDGHQTLQ